LSLRNTELLEQTSQIEPIDYRVPMNSPNVINIPTGDNPQPFYCCDMFFNNYFEYQNHTQQIHGHGNYTMEGATINNPYSQECGNESVFNSAIDINGFSPQSSYHSPFDRNYTSSGYGSNHTGSTVLDHFHITPASSAVPSRTGSPVSVYSPNINAEQRLLPFPGYVYSGLNQANPLGVRYPVQHMMAHSAATAQPSALDYPQEPDISNTHSFNQEIDDFFSDLDPVQQNDSFGMYPLDSSHQRPLSECSSLNDVFNKSPMLTSHSPDLGSSSSRNSTSRNKTSKKTRNLQRPVDLKSEEINSVQKHEGKVYKCTIGNCGKLYKTPNGLKYHRVYHHGVLPNSAPSSPKASEPIEFDFPETVRPSYVHPMFRRYKCLIGDCDKKYKNMSGLRYHIANGHPEVSESVQKEYLRSSKERGDNGEFAEFPEVPSHEIE
jgi:hypothetical protein